MRWLLLVLAAVSCLGCDRDGSSSCTAWFQGEHVLHRLAADTIVRDTPAAGSFFVLVGDFHGATHTEERAIKFAWEMAGGEYQLTTLPLEKIRVRIDDTHAEAPKVKFRWRPYTCRQQDYLDKIIYAVLLVAERDWPLRIDVNEALQ